MRFFGSRAVIIAASLAAARAVGAQQPHAPTWSFTLELGGFVQGNGNAVLSWLRRNAYGVAEPKHCGFDYLFRPLCDAAVDYPRVHGHNVVGWMGSVRRALSDRVSLDLYAASEQGGTATGRCDDLAVPKDPRCTSRFMDIEFSGGSFALVTAVTRGGLHLGVGPAILLANWEMKPAHLEGFWVDATFERGTFPVFAHAQYRLYRSTNLSPGSGFTAFHPSTLYAGLGFITRANNGGQ